MNKRDKKSNFLVIAGIHTRRDNCSNNKENGISKIPAIKKRLLEFLYFFH